MEPTTNTTKESYPVSLTIPRQEKYSRLLAIATILFMVGKLIVTIPHLFILYFLSFFAFLAAVIGQFAVLFTGKYPASVFHFVEGTLRWRTRVGAYIFGLTDSYPPFYLHD